MSETASHADADAQGQPQMAQLEIRKGAEAELRVGGLRFLACRREVGKFDGGISLNVWGLVEGEDRELLRFDFFRTRPHYHSPAENQAEVQIEPAAGSDSASWGIETLTRRAPELVATAGYGALAETLEPSEFEAASGALRTLFDELEEPTEISYFDVPVSVLKALEG